MKILSTLNSLCKFSQCIGGSHFSFKMQTFTRMVLFWTPWIQTQPIIIPVMYLSCKHILPSHASPEDIHSHAQRTCCLLSISSFHKFTININPDLENKLWTKENRLKNRFSLMRGFSVSSSQPTFYLAFVRNCEATFSGDTHAISLVHA